MYRKNFLNNLEYRLLKRFEQKFIKVITKLDQLI